MTDTLTSILSSKQVPQEPLRHQHMDEPTAALMDNGKVAHRAFNANLGINDANAIRHEQWNIPRAEEIKGVDLDAVDDTNPEMHKLDHHFAQPGNKVGFTYEWTDRRGVPHTTIFDSGVLVTRDIRLVQLLRHDIRRTDGIGMFVQEITAAHYQNIMVNLERAQQFAAVMGPASTRDGDANAKAREERAALLENENASLRAQLAALTNQVPETSVTPAAPLKDGKFALAGADKPKTE